MSVNVSAITLDGWNYGGTTATLYVWANQTYLASDNTLVQQGTFGDVRTFAAQGACAVSGTEITIPLITLQPTTDSDLPLATLCAALVDSYGALVSDFGGFNGAQFRLPHDLGATISWQMIREYNASPASPDVTQTRDCYSKTATDALIAAAILTASDLPDNVKKAEQYGTLAAAYAANPTDEVTIWITEPLQTGAAAAQPDNVQLMFTANGRLTTSAPRTVTLTRPPIAASDQWCFDVASGALTIACGGSCTEVSAQWFGAVGDGVTDDFIPLQAALNAVCAGGKGTLLLYATDANFYQITAPLYHATDGVTIEGVGAQRGIGEVACPTIRGSYHGPLVVIGKLVTNPTYTTSLLSGGGNAVVINSQATYLNFNDVARNLHGIAQWSVEVTLKPTSYTSTVDQYANIFSSYGVRSQNFFTTVSGLVGRAFRILVDGVGKLLAYATIGGTLYQLGPSAVGGLVLNANNNLHLRFNGTTLGFYNNGTLIASTSASGTWTQLVHEDVSISPIFLQWPETSSAQVCQLGTYDNIRISNTARSTANPTAKFTADANTLLLQKFLDTSRNPVLPVEIGASGTGYMMARCSSDGEYTNNAGLNNLYLYNDAGPALILHSCPYFHTTGAAASGIGTAVLFYGLKFLSLIDDFSLTSFGTTDCKVGLAMAQAAGAGLRISRSFLTGYGYPLAMVDGATSISETFLNNAPETIALVYSCFGTLEVMDAYLDIEQGVASGVTREGFVILSGCFATTVFTGGKFNNARPEVYPHIVIDAPYAHGGLNIDGTRFISITGDSVIDFTGIMLSGTSFPININNANKLDSYSTPSTKPWILPADENVLNVQELGKTTAPRALSTVVSAVHAIDNNRTLTYGLGTVGNLLIPAGLPLGMTFKVVQTGSNAIQLVAGSGVTMTAPSGALSNGANSIVTVTATGTEAYLVTGNVTTSVFTPLSLSPKQWYAGNHILGLSNTDPVSSWVDSSGNDYHMTSFDNTHRPEYKTALKNSLPGVFFDATSSSVGEGLGNLAYALPRPCTLIAVYAPTASGFRAGNNGALTGASGTATLGTSATNHIAKAGATTITAGAIGVGTYVVSVLTIDGSGNAEFFINNVSIGTATGVTSPENMLLGQYNDFPNPLIGNGLEFLTFNSVLSGANLTAIYNYLVSKWALP